MRGGGNVPGNNYMYYSKCGILHTETEDEVGERGEGGHTSLHLSQQVHPALPFQRFVKYTPEC